MAKFGVGQAVTRVEDSRLLTGKGTYTDDVHLDGEAHAYILRSPHAHARFTVGDLEAARAAPGVLAVFTVEDLEAAGIGHIQSRVPVTNRDGSAYYVPPRPALAAGTVRHVGEGIALVVAGTLEQARDAAELIDVDYEELPAVVDMPEAIADGAPVIWEGAPDNLSFDWGCGDETATNAALSRADRVVTLTVVNNRLVVNPMEPRCAVGNYDKVTDRYELYVPTQGVHNIRKQLADTIFNLPEDRFRVVTKDVGGGFGMKLFLYEEYILVTFAAKEVGRPVRWAAERGEDFVTDTHGRDNLTTAQLGLDRDGRFLVLKVDTLANIGSCHSNFAGFVATACGTPMLPGVYDIPAAYARVRGVFTNTTPVDAYRGAGRPEAAYVIERMADAAARETGLGQDEIRRRNFIPPTSMPYETALGQVYDSGDFVVNMEQAMETAGWSDFESRRKAARAEGRLLGLGMAYYVEACGGGGPEWADVAVAGSGEVTVRIGTQSNGQGHETAYSQIVAEHLGVPLERVRIVQGDTDIVERGSGTGGSRSLPVGGVALDKASVGVVEKGRRIASFALEAAPDDIEYAEGRFTIAGTDRSMTLEEVAQLAEDADRLPEGETPGLTANDTHTPPAATYPNGCHICELEIDEATGVPRLLRYVVVDDFGAVINPLLLQGQVHGGIAQGVGQALLEECRYDTDSGQLVTGSFMDYCMPRADDMMDISFAMHNVPCTTNPMGLKGCGEAGAIGAPPAVINAVLDALKPFGVGHIDMPATPEKIWRAVQDASPAAAAE